jgi:hypothetical protein
LFEYFQNLAVFGFKDILHECGSLVLPEDTYLKQRFLRTIGLLWFKIIAEII